MYKKSLIRQKINYICVKKNIHMREYCKKEVEVTNI